MEKTRYNIQSEFENSEGSSRKRRRQKESKKDPLTELFEVISLTISSLCFFFFFFYYYNGVNLTVSNFYCGGLAFLTCKILKKGDMKMLLFLCRMLISIHSIEPIARLQKNLSKLGLVLSLIWVW